MKITIRKGTFETNSSSVHSICISKSPVSNVKGQEIYFGLQDYGWEFGEADPATYLYTAIMCYDYDEDDGTNEATEMLDKLKSILDKYEIDYTFQSYNEEDRGYYYIDHYTCLRDFLDTILNDEDMLLRYLFGDSTIYTGNDNCTSETDHIDDCYIGEAWYWDDDSHCQMPNPYHDEDNFDYFVKGN